MSKLFILTFVFFSSFAKAQNILITTQDLKTESKELTKSFCESIKNIENIKAQVICTYTSPYDLNNTMAEQLKKNNDFNYHIHVLKLNNPANIIEITTELKQEDNLDPKKVSIQFKGTDEDNRQNFIKYFKNCLIITLYLLVFYDFIEMFYLFDYFFHYLDEKIFKLSSSNVHSL